MNYLFIILVGYLLNTAAILIDKVLVGKKLQDAVVYTFYAGIMSFLVLTLVPFGFYFPSFSVIFLSFLSGLAFLIGLYTLYSSLKSDESSVVSPIVGTINPFIALVIGLFLFGDKLSSIQFLSFGILIAGLSLVASSHLFSSKLETKHLLVMIVSGLCFAISSVLLRHIFLQTTFINGLVLSYTFIGLISLSFLFIPKFTRKLAFSKVNQNHLVNQTSKLLLLGKIFGASGGLLIIFAYSLQNPAIVNSLQGIQYVFILILVALMPKKFRNIFGENLSKQGWMTKIVGAAIIALGLGVLFLNS